MENKDLEEAKTKNVNVPQPAQSDGLVTRPKHTVADPLLPLGAKDKLNGQE